MLDSSVSNEQNFHFTFYQYMLMVGMVIEIAVAYVVYAMLKQPPIFLLW